MSDEENKAGQRRVWEEAFGKGNLEVIDELFAPSYSFKSPLGIDIKGAEGFKQNLAMMRSAFPDMNISIDDMLAVDEKVVTRFTMKGTFTGEMMGIPPTGKDISVSGIVITRWENGKEVEAWESIDTLSFYQQLGITPPER
jgi:steroid delta-isomerase-like uncharacterized protein